MRIDFDFGGNAPATTSRRRDLGVRFSMSLNRCVNRPLLRREVRTGVSPPTLTSLISSLRCIGVIGKAEDDDETSGSIAAGASVGPVADRSENFILDGVLRGAPKMEDLLRASSTRCDAAGALASGAAAVEVVDVAFLVECLTGSA